MAKKPKVEEAASNAVVVKAGTLGAILQQALVFINKAKVALQPIYSSILLKDSKMYVFNGESGAHVDLPFVVPGSFVLIPFDLTQLVQAFKPDNDVQLIFSEDGANLKVVCGSIKATFRLIDAKRFPDQPLPAGSVDVAIENLYAKVKRAAMCASSDATNPLMQGVRISKTSVCATDMRRIYHEESESSEEFVISHLLTDQLLRLGCEPVRVSLTDNQVLLHYTDKVVFGLRVAEDNKYPDVNGVVTRVSAEPDVAVVQYDREAFRSQLETVLLLNPEDDKLVMLASQDNVLKIRNFVVDADKTEADCELECTSSANFSDVLINGKLLLETLETFSELQLKDKRLLFAAKGKTCCIARRTIQ